MVDRVRAESDLPLISKRLILDMPAPAKAPRVLNYLVINRVRFADATPSGAPPTEDLIAANLGAAISDYEQGRGMKLYMFLRDTNVEDPIGDIALSEIVRGAFQACYLGYKIGAEFEGQGYVTESIDCVVEYAFRTLNLHRIMANYVPGNERSAAVLRRTGFMIEGTARDYLRLNGEWRDHVLTSRVNPKWAPLVSGATPHRP